MWLGREEHMPRLFALKRHFRGYVPWQTQGFACAASECVRQAANRPPLPAAVATTCLADATIAPSLFASSTV
jgi:hypothetical protein